MKFTVKKLQTLKGMGYINLVVPVPLSEEEEINKIDPEKQYVVEVKQWRKGRSNDANKYACLLCQKIAEKLSEESYHSQVDVYRKAIKDCGHYTPVPIKNEAVDRWREIWQGHGIGWIAEVFSECRNTPGYTNMLAYHGSRVYDTKEMSRLIDCLVSMAKDIGVETRPQEELDELIKEWGVKDDSKNKEDKT